LSKFAASTIFAWACWLPKQSFGLRLWLGRPHGSGDAQASFPERAYKSVA